jgi:hypothetical protein
MNNTHITEINQVVNVLRDCAKMCRSLSTSSALVLAEDLSLPDVPKLVRLVNDCAASCDIAILLIERKSHIAVDFLEVCEELAMECAWECSKYGFDVFKKCAVACESAAKACLPFIVEKEDVD